MSKAPSGSISKGSCLCSSVAYEMHGEPVFANVCHCINCQKIGGSAMAVSVIFLEEQIKISDPHFHLKGYEDRQTGSGNALIRYFCSQCGSSMLVKPPHVPGMPQTMVVMSGTIDDWAEKEKREGSRWVPKAELFCGAGRRPWLPELAGVPAEMCFERMMTKEALASIVQSL